MNPSDWIKATAVVTQHKQEAATTETDQLSSMPLNQIAMDDSSPPVVHYGMHMPVVKSMPTGTDVHMHSSQQEESYQQIIPGIPQGSLYPTLSSLSSETAASQEEVQQQCTLEPNYFDDSASCISEEPILEDAEQTTQPSKGNQSVAKQKSIEDTKVTRNTLESLKLDTGHTSRQLSQVCTDSDEQQITTSEDVAQDTDTQRYDRKHTVEGFTSKPTLIHSEQPNTMPTFTDEVIMPTEKVGFILVSSHLKQFLEDYPPSSDKQAF